MPAGRYAIERNGKVTFYKVDRPTDGKWAGYTFVRIQAGDELHQVAREHRAAVLAAIAEDGPENAMLRYGRELGHCGHCGKTLTNEDSRERGIGPVCASRMGW